MATLLSCSTILGFSLTSSLFFDKTSNPSANSASNNIQNATTSAHLHYYCHHLSLISTIIGLSASAFSLYLIYSPFSIQNNLSNAQGRFLSHLCSKFSSCFPTPIPNILMMAYKYLLIWAPHSSLFSHSTISSFIHLLEHSKHSPFLLVSLCLELSFPKYPTWLVSCDLRTPHKCRFINDTSLNDNF